MFGPWIRKIPWRKAWQPTPVFFPREFQGRRNLACYSPWGRRVNILTDVRWKLIYCLDLYFHDNKCVEHFFRYLFAICTSSLKNMFIQFSVHFKNRLFRFVAVVVCYWIVSVFIYFGYYLLSDIWFINTFAHSMFAFSFVDGFLCCAEAI